MTSTPLPAAGYFSNPARLNSEAKSGQDAQLAFIRQSVLGASAVSTLTIASGAVTPTTAVHAVDTEAAAAADDLTNVLVTNMEDGQLLVLSGVASARVTTVKHAAGGSGQIFLQDDTEYALDDENTLILRRNGAAWYEVSRNNGAQHTFYCGTASGTANALTATTNVTIPALKAGFRFHMLASAANTSGTVTANINGFGAKTIKQVVNSKVLLGVGSIGADTPLDLLFDGTDLIWMNPPAHVRGADIASSGTVNLNNATGDCVDVTGTTTITAITLREGSQSVVRFTGALTLTHGSSLVLPGSANITTAAGDFAIFRGYASGVVRCVSYTRSTGQAVVASGGITSLAIRTPGAVTTDLLTGIPSNVKRVTINFMGISKGGTGDIAVQVGPSGGVVSTGYLGGAFRNGSSAGNTTCMFGNGSWSGLGAVYGSWVMELVDAATNTWVWHGSLWTAGGFIIIPAGQIALSGPLERILITDAGGSPGNFAGGSWQVSYES